MNEYEKAAFLFEYLERFRETCLRYGNIPAEEATLLYYEKIELYKLQLLQNGITRQISETMYMRLTSSILTQYLFQKRDGRLWQLRCEPFVNNINQAQNGIVPPVE